MDGCSSYNDVKVRRSSRTKKQARKKFEEHQIPHAQGQIFFWPWKAFSFVKQHGFPIVLKPNLGTYSRGSYFPISNYRELLTSLIKVKLWWPFTVIEKYLKGKNYRVVETKEGTQVVMRRYPPFVIGDGKKTIAQLIDSENEIRKQMKLLPTIHEIMKDKQIEKHLKKQKLKFESVPKAGQEVELFHRVALSPGGSLETIDPATIPVENKKLFQKILKAFDSNIFGIDVIMEKGIEFPYDQQQCIFLEVNSRPYLKMHHYPRWGEAPDMQALYDQLEQLEIKDQDIF